MTQGNQFILLWTLLTVLGTLAAMFTFWGFLVFLPIVVFVLQSLLLFAYMEPKNGIIWWLNIGCVLLFFEFKDDMFLMFVLMAVLGEVVFSLAFSRFSFLMWSLIYVAGFSLFHFLLPIESTFILHPCQLQIMTLSFLNA